MTLAVIPGSLWAWALGAALVGLGAVTWWWLRRALRGLSAQLAVLTLAVQDVRDALAAPDDAPPL